MSSAKVAVVIPIFKEKLDELEKISLAQVRKVLKNYPIIFVAPKDKNFSYLESGDILIQFHPQYFQSVKAYSQLLMSPFFYEPFLICDYILLYQLDAFVFYDALEDFCQLGYDYIGAPWPVSWSGFKTPRVGNGGFCLRKVKTCYELLTVAVQRTDWEDILANTSEDGFFAIRGATKGINFNVAPIEVANLFSMEHYPDRCVKKLGYKLPFGCHGWTKLSADFYVELLAQLGYDLRPFRNQMQTNDYEIFLPRSLEMVAMERLIRDLNRKESLLRYLPTKRFASIRVIKSPDAMKILSRLLTEENSITDKIFIYDEKNSRDLIRDLTSEDLSHLVLSYKNDEKLIAAIERKGLIYGKHVISFQREYMNFQEKLFHNLGRG